MFAPGLIDYRYMESKNMKQSILPSIHETAHPFRATTCAGSFFLSSGAFLRLFKSCDERRSKPAGGLKWMGKEERKEENQ